MMSTKRYMFWLAVLLTLTIFVFALPVSAALEVGDKAPDFKLRSVDGRGTVKLSTYRGKPMLVAFWASWCPHCREEMPILQKVYNQLHPRGVQAIGVSLDERIKDAQEFVKSKSITFPIAYAGKEKGYKLADSYGVGGIPMTFVLDKKGVVRAIFKGDASARAIRAAFRKLGVK